MTDRTIPDPSAPAEATPDLAPAVEADPRLWTLEARLPEGYDFDGQMILKLGPAGRVRPLCGPVMVEAEARNAEGAGWCAEIAFRAWDDVWRSTVVAMRDLLGNPSRVVLGMVDLGFDLRGRPQEVTEMLRSMPADRVGKAIEGTGWAGEGFETFVCPSGEVVARAGQPRNVIFSGAPRVMGQKSPSDRDEAAKIWGSNVLKPGASDATILGLFAALAPAILPIEGHGSFLLHLHGNEAAARVSRTVAAAVWGPPQQLTLSWTQPLAQILSAVEAARDGLVAIAGYEPRHHRKLAPVAEAMAAMDTAGRHRVVILSTGQASLHPADGRVLDGQDLRTLIDIDMRVWDAEHAEDIEQAAGTNAGVFGPQLMQSAIDWDLSRKRTFFQIRTEEILEPLTKANAGPVDAETDRVSRVFGALHGAGAVLELRQPDLGLTRSTAFLRRLFQEWVNRHRGLLSVPERILLGKAATRIRDLLRDDALTPLDTAEGIVPLSEVGWFDTEAVYLSVRTMTDIAAAGGATMDRLVDLLLGQTLLQHGRERGNQFRLPSRVPGRPRAYKIPRAEILRYAEATPAGPKEAGD